MAESNEICRTIYIAINYYKSMMNMKATVKFLKKCFNLNHAECSYIASYCTCKLWTLLTQ